MPRTRPSPLWYRVAYCARVLKKKCFSVVRPVTFLLFPRRIKHSMSNRRITNTCTKVYDGRDDFKRFRDFRHTRINISISTGGRLRKINDLIVMSATVENVQKRYVRLVSECDLINRTILRVDAFFFFFFINTGIVFIILNPIESRYSLSSRSIWRHTHLIKKKHRFIRKTFRVISVPFVRDRPPTQYSSGQANNVFIPLLLLEYVFTDVLRAVLFVFFSCKHDAAQRKRMTTVFRSVWRAVRVLSDFDCVIARWRRERIIYFEIRCKRRKGVPYTYTQKID